MSTALIKYDEMCRAIDAAYEVDEVKDLRDKAYALEAYFRQAKNPEPERRACEIRLRAERRAGQLLAEMDNAKTGPKNNCITSRHVTPTLAELGITLKQSSQWQQLAAVPSEEFEAALATPEKPTISRILDTPQATPMNPNALWLWGRLRDFERNGILREDPQRVLSAMTDGMQTDVQRLIPLIVTWLKEVIP